MSWFRVEFVLGLGVIFFARVTQGCGVSAVREKGIEDARCSHDFPHPCVCWAMCLCIKFVDK